MKRHVFSFLAMTCSSFPFSAAADIGGIGGIIGGVGSPVVPSNGPAPTPPQIPPGMENLGKPDEGKSAKPEPTQIDDIVFNQNRVNFQSDLHHAIAVNERNTPGAVYEVISTIPNTNNMSPSQIARLNITYNANQEAVMEEILAAGVPADRVHARTVVSDDVGNQDIAIMSWPQTR